MSTKPLYRWSKKTVYFICKENDLLFHRTKTQRHGLSGHARLKIASARSRRLQVHSSICFCRLVRRTCQRNLESVHKIFGQKSSLPDRYARPQDERVGQAGHCADKRLLIRGFHTGCMKYPDVFSYPTRVYCVYYL